MRLLVSYIVFDGIELLESSINQIRDQVDIIHVVYQNVSWFNKQILQKDVNILIDLKNRRLIDKLECFTNFKPLTDTTQNSVRISKQYEIKKRELGLKSAIQEHATHFMSMDVDEFYKNEDFYRAKEIIKENDFDLTSCRFINYVKTAEYHRGYDPKFVPFICKINNISKIGSGFFVQCDPTRGISPGVNNFEFSEGLITMHHMETVRINLKNKYESTTRFHFNRSQIDTLVNAVNNSNENVNFAGIIYPSLRDQKLTKVENIFDIKI